jgi:hypothetical protein
MADPDFVGRAELVAQILGDVGGPGRTGTFFNIGGIPGIGKTRLLDQLAKLTRPEDVVVRINGSDFEARGSRKRTATSDEDAELRQFRILLRGALESLPDDEQITDVLKYLTDYSPSTQRAQQADFVHDPDEVLERATGAANDLGKTLAATQARFLVLVDDFHFLAGRPLGQWVIAWLAGIRGADVVVTHEDFSGAEDPGLPARAVRLPLGNLSREDVEAYLKSHSDIGPDVAGIVNHVWDFTGGYPRALVLVADLIKGSGSRDNAVQLIGQLAALQGGRAAQLEALINRILDMIHDEELRDTLYRVCVTRHFDGPLVERLMKVDESRAQTLIDRLMHYSFVRKSAGEHSFFAVSDFVRRSGENRLGVTQTQVALSLAAEYYQGLIVGAVDEDETSYQSWFRYEQPAFQALERDWLYHLSRLTGIYRRAGRVGIARIFLDAFWWWGYYIPFPFCEQILADWTDATLADGEDRAWGAQLRVVYDSYPKGWRKADTPAEQWKTVRLALRYLWNRAGFDQSQPDDQEMRHIRGILDFFLADAVRYVDPGDPEADERLDDAAEQFAANEDADEDEWDLAWVEYYRADLAVSREQADPAISMAKESADRHPDLDDDELVANLHRVCADAQWLRRDPGAALDADARAVLHAYRFQVKDVQDDYTDAFQQEMIERSMERLAAWHGDDQDTGHAGLRSACARIRAFFGPYWREAGAGPLADVGLDVIRALDEGRLDDVAGVLFPARPTVLGYHGTPYALTCVEVTHRMKRELAQPPGTPLPPAET